MLDPVKLVGMSEGSKKRKRWAIVQCAGQYDAPGAAKYIGEPLRIGERLAPCRYCRGPALYDRCKGWRIAQHIMGGHIRGECVFCMTCEDRRMTARLIPDDVCDGSGVVPAKKAKNR